MGIIRITEKGTKSYSSIADAVNRNCGRKDLIHLTKYSIRRNILHAARDGKEFPVRSGLYWDEVE